MSDSPIPNPPDNQPHADSSLWLPDDLRQASSVAIEAITCSIKILRIAQGPRTWDESIDEELTGQVCNLLHLGQKARDKLKLLADELTRLRLRSSLPTPTFCGFQGQFAMGLAVKFAYSVLDLYVLPYERDDGDWGAHLYPHPPLNPLARQQIRSRLQLLPISNAQAARKEFTRMIEEEATFAARARLTAEIIPVIPIQDQIRLTTAQVAAIIGVSDRTVYEWRKNGRLTSYEDKNGHLVFSKSTLELLRGLRK
jgi:excisionase family DNA binding protein